VLAVLLWVSATAQPLVVRVVSAFLVVVAVV
jgi:hypothetical protein